APGLVRSVEGNQGALRRRGESAHDILLTVKIDPKDQQILVLGQSRNPLDDRFLRGANRAPGSADIDEDRPAGLLGCIELDAIDPGSLRRRRRGAAQRDGEKQADDPKATHFYSPHGARDHGSEVRRNSEKGYVVVMTRVTEPRSALGAPSFAAALR